MTPETVEGLRARLLKDAPRALSGLICGDPLTVRTRNGRAGSAPDSRTVALNRELAAAWERAALIPGVEVVSGPVRTRLAPLIITSEVRFGTAGALAAFLGGGWPALLREAEALVQSRPALRCPEFLRLALRHGPDDLRALGAFCSWREEAGGEAAGLTMIREVPAAGVHTKWAEQTGPLLIAAFRALGWLTSEEGPLAERLGMATEDLSEVWVRLTPQDAAAAGLWPRFGVPAGMMSGLPAGVERVIIIENKTTFLRFPLREGEAALYGAGKAAVAWAAASPWLNRLRVVAYWGDCDGAGYLILDRVRRTVPGAVSVMMGWGEISAHLGRAGPEADSESVSAPMPRLTDDEARARVLMSERGLRLEQERLPMGEAVKAFSLIMRPCG